VTRKRALIIGWLVALALSAAIPISAVFHGVVHIGTQPLSLNNVARRPIVSIGSDTILHRGSRSLVVSILGNVRVDGIVSNDVVTLDGDVFVGTTGRVRGDVLSVVGSVYRQSGGRIDGRIGGDLHRWNGTFHGRHHDVGTAALRNVRLGLAAGLALLLVGTCIVIVFPWQIVLIASTLRDSPYRSFSAGVMGLLIFLFLVVPLGLSLAGLPFALLLVSGAALAWLFGIAATGVVVGRALSRGPVSLVWASAAGLLLLAISMAIPFVGPLLITALGLTGAGALAVALLGRSQPASPIR